jgi:ech hydrogenase subunit E
MTDTTLATSAPAAKFVLPIGPQHPALKEPGHFEFTLEGETIVGAKLRLGYVHRGIEKATESRNWTQNLYLLERVCGICSHIHTTAYVLGVERLAGVEAPPRAQAIRTLLAELERIHSHLLWLGVGAHEAGFDALFMYAWRDRETVMDLLEGLSGNRVHYSTNVLGGVKFDVSAEQAQALRQGIDFLTERCHHYLDVVSRDAALLRRTRGIGYMSAAQAGALGVVGPAARGSGLARDIRVDAPYAAYARYPVEMALDPGGDLAARFAVRLVELLHSCDTIRAILADLPPGELTTRMPRKIKAGETISRVEAPRGELFYFLKSNGTEMPERIHVVTPSLRNFAATLSLMVGQKLADAPMLLAGMDPCFSCNDRAVRLDRPGHDQEYWTWEQLRQWANDAYRPSAEAAPAPAGGPGMMP